MTRTDGLTYTQGLRRQYQRNAAGLRSMLSRAEATGRKVNGYTVEQLRAHVAEYERIAKLDDAALAEHVSTAWQRAAAKCAS